MVTGEDVVTAARKYLGVRYQHQGRTRHGLDCAGLVVRVVHDLGVSEFDSRDYGRQPDPARMWATLRLNCAELPRSDWAPGCLAFMHFQGHPMHLGIITPHPQGWGLIHALATSRKVVEHRLDSEWDSRIVAAFTLPGTA